MALSSLSERPSLPFDLVEEILCRVPIESLTRFQLTCKQWFGLFKDKRFIYKHLAFVQQQQFLRFSFLVNSINHEDKSFKPMPPTLIVQGRVETSVTAHCDGLLLCRFDLGKLVIWNPYLKQVKWIRSMDPYSYEYYYAIGYGLSRDDDGYKILRFYDGHDEEGNYHWPNDPEVEIYSFKSSLWRTLESSWGWYVFRPNRGVSLNGNTYWIAKRNHDSNLFIQCFDFSMEKFEPVCSLPLTFGVSDFTALSDFGGDKLSLLHQRKETTEVEIWITSKIKNGVVVSWTKLFNVVRPNLPELHVSTFSRDLDDPVFFIDKNNRIVVCCEELLENDEMKVCARVYVIGEDRLEKTIKIRNHRDHGGPRWPFICSYVLRPSLVPVPK